MSEKTLKQIGDEATWIRGAHREDAERVKALETLAQETTARAANTYDELIASGGKKREKLENKYDRAVVAVGEASVDAVVAKRHFDNDHSGTIQAATNHYRKHEAEYHDIATMEARLDGVDINVEQPMEASQKIPVHSPEK